ncbi:MAG: hypothetical protein V4471_00245 [Pseudomonadota bacterium]
MGKAAAFDTLTYANKLKKAGVPKEQAETHAQLLSEVIINRIITPQYLDTKLAEVNAKIDIKIAELRAELIRWVLGAAIAQTSIVLSCLKLIH